MKKELSVKPRRPALYKMFPRVTEIPKSPRTPRPKKDKQTIGPIRMSPRNPQHNKLSMEEKGKAVTIKTDEEEEDL